MYSIDDLALAFQDLYSCNFKNYKTICPFHQEKTASLSLKNFEKPRYMCFSCKESGDIWDLYQKALGVSFQEAVEMVNNKFGINPPKNYFNNNNHELRKDMKNLHIEKAIEYSKKNKLKYIISYEYSDRNYKHRFLSQSNKKTFIHTYFDSEKNTVVFNKDLLNDRDKESVCRIYNKAKIEYAISNNLSFYICEGEKDADNLSKLGFISCHIETGKEEELNKMLKNNLNYNKDMFHIFDKEISRIGINKAYKRSESINYEKQYLIEPKEKDISDDIEMHGKENTKHNVRIQSNCIKTSSFIDEERAYAYNLNEKTGKKTLIANIKNIEKYLDINLEATLCVDCITKKSLIIYNGGTIEINDDRTASSPYLLVSAISDILNNKLGVNQIKSAIDDIWNKRKVNLFDIMLKKYETSDSSEFDKLVNNFYKSIDQEFTSKEVFIELFTFFFTRTVRRAIDYGKRPDQVIKMVFTIIGDQSCGKSTFVREIFNDMNMCQFVKKGVNLSSLSKDIIINVTNAPIVELAETTYVLKSTKYSEELKNFISQSSDCYRAPYAKENISHPRISSYIYTTNEKTILRDKTGNTRFYAVKAVKALPRLTKYNMKNVWGYIYHMAMDIPENDLNEYYDIPPILSNYISKNSDDLYDTSHYVDELFNLKSNPNEYRLYTKTSLEDLLQIRDRKSKLDFHSSLYAKKFEYKVYRMGKDPITGIDRTLKGYKLNTLIQYPQHGEPFYK